MHIVMIAAEAAPVAKVGGLADMVTGLSRELATLGHRVELMLPFHQGLATDQVQGLHKLDRALRVPGPAGEEIQDVYAGRVEKLEAKLFPCGDQFARADIYGYDDDALRYAQFNRTVLEYLAARARWPDILHTHDWHTGLIGPLLRNEFTASREARTRIVFSIHNIEYQGQCAHPQRLLKSIGLHAPAHLRADRLADPHHPGLVNLLQAGIVYADVITTVSPTYLAEIQTPLGGRGLDGLLRSQAHKLVSILNGIDCQRWNPATDALLHRTYTADTFRRKFANRKALRRRLGLPETNQPIVACVSRLVSQKGTPLIRHALYRTVEAGGQAVLLGTSPDPGVQASFERVASVLAPTHRAAVRLVHDEELSHLVFGGADMLIVPSLFEPCGLTQLIALRYGTVPLVRRTGGLADTVVDPAEVDRLGAKANGYVFNDPDERAVDWVLTRALSDYRHRVRRFRRLARNGMRADHCWGRSAREYERVYRRAAGL